MKNLKKSQESKAVDELTQLNFQKSKKENQGKEQTNQLQFSPSIFDATLVKSDAIDDCLSRAKAMAFNSVLVKQATDTFLKNAELINLKVFEKFDLLDSEYHSLLIVKNVQSDITYESSYETITRQHSSANKILVDKFILSSKRGVSGFFCHALISISADDWKEIISCVKRAASGAIFFAYTPGLTENQIKELINCGFDFSISSSCWWNFRSEWLNKETRYLRNLAPQIALTAPVNAEYPFCETKRRRALMLAATFSSGWLMPSGFEICEDYQLSVLVKQLNELRNSTEAFRSKKAASVMSSAGSSVAILIREDKFLLMINAESDIPVQCDLNHYPITLTESGVIWTEYNQKISNKKSDIFHLPPAGVCLFEGKTEEPIISKRMLEPYCDAARIAIEEILPKVNDGSYPVKRVVGETLLVEADIIVDGHEKVLAALLFKPVSETEWQSSSMTLVENDRWSGNLLLRRLGRYEFIIKAWIDHYGTLVDEIVKKYTAKVDINLMVLECNEYIKNTADKSDNNAAVELYDLLKKIEQKPLNEKYDILISSEVIDLVRLYDVPKFLTMTSKISVDSERKKAQFSSWYELFPRSQSGYENLHGTFQDVIGQLPRISNMGFDVLYFPPIHPIGKINRKGRNNSLVADETDPGSPYAIGNELGGHEAIHPELGDMNDFIALIRSAKEYDIEIALDFAIQCAPDHPWIREHKEWFKWQPDGSIRYAENPPKKYQDIVNVDFYANEAKPSLWLALRDIVEHWVAYGIKIFRVDNPHTKPLPFWEWMIKDIRGRNPEVIFLAEAFTRPKLMYRLAKVGFSQSYTYFTWRNTKAELQSYLIELTTLDVKEFFRPLFFVNTPDINPEFLKKSGRSGFLIRAALASTLSGLWGIYSGFELCEAAAIPGKEEYIDSEKYQIRAWNYTVPGNIANEISKLNDIRRSNAALHSHLGVEFHTVFDDQVIFFSKTAMDGNAVLVAISLDPFSTHHTTLELPLSKFGIPDNGQLPVVDVMANFEFTWIGKYQSVTLHPDMPFCIWRVEIPNGQGLAHE